MSGVKTGQHIGLELEKISQNDQKHPYLKAAAKHALSPKLLCRTHVIYLIPEMYWIRKIPNKSN